MPPHQPPGPFPFSGVLLLLISLPHTFRHEQGRGVSPDRWALSSPLTAGLFRDVCLSSRISHTQEGGVVGPGGALHQAGPQCKAAASTGAVSLPSVPSWWRAPVPWPCSGCPHMPVGMGQVEAGEMGTGLCPGAPSCPHSSQTLHC